jgi:hypothetical protein
MAQPLSDRDRTADRAELPLACALEAVDGAERLVRWRTLFEMSSPQITREPEQIVVLLGEAPGVAAELDALTAAERACCSFVEWHVVHDGAWHVLQIRGSNDELDAIAAIFLRD